MPFHNLDDIPRREMLSGCHARFVHAENMTLSYWDLDPGAIIPPHSHPHEQVTSLISGEMEMTVGGETRHLTPGCVVTLPSGTEHSVKALSACYVVDAFWPVREDYQ